MSFDTLMTFTDRLFLSRVSPDHERGARRRPMQMILLHILHGLIGYSTAMVAQNLGAKRNGTKEDSDADALPFLRKHAASPLIPVGYLIFGMQHPRAGATWRKDYLDSHVAESSRSVRNAFRCFFFRDRRNLS